ncbi:unnamed protein product (mitochondrion) [Plasmodiophora brassicae]|uniref:Uncharacterized protein n=1 Tax=Plasmodiophora brassicae TaxID=37360 RepID=A0A0G4J1R5_PLABS|nr:hypothetical protein PBRA_008525 [Plasmodiophora brassicae]SPR01756.1 unnamed protein product [Plasmodiophora brassicae]
MCVGSSVASSSHALHTSYGVIDALAQRDHLMQSLSVGGYVLCRDGTLAFDSLTAQTESPRHYRSSSRALMKQSTDGYAAAASRILAAANSYPVPYDERDEITAALLELLPEHRRDLVRVVLSGLAFLMIHSAILLPGRNRDFKDDLLKVKVAHGMNLCRYRGRNPGVAIPEKDRFDVLVSAAVAVDDFRTANQLIALGSGTLCVMEISEYWNPDKNGASTFAKQIMTFHPDYEDLDDIYMTIWYKFESYRQHFGMADDKNPMLLEPCLNALRRRYGAQFDECDWKRRVLIRAIGVDNPWFPNEMPLTMFDDGAVILSGSGVAALTNVDVCRVRDPVSALDHLARHATDANVQEALRHVNEHGYTVFHKDCMTGDIVHWILLRASNLDWVWAALNRLESGASCIEHWLRQRNPCDDKPVTSILTNLAAANGTMSAYEVAVMACAGSPRGIVALLTWPASMALTIDHLARRRVLHMKPHHADLIKSKIGDQPLGPMLNSIRALEGDSALQAFLLERYDGLSPIHWAVMMDQTAVEIVMEQAQRLGILTEVVVRRDVPARWTILHTAAINVIHWLYYSAAAMSAGLLTDRLLYRQRLSGQLEMLFQIVLSLPARLASVDDFCRLVSTRDFRSRDTFVDILQRARFGHDFYFARDPFPSILYDSVVNRHVNDMTAFIRQHCRSFNPSSLLELLNRR